MIRRVTTPTSCCRFGLATGDVTPPVGIYHRMWGAATHERATGVHRPLTAAALAFAPVQGGPEPGCVIVAIDHCLLWGGEMAAFRQTVLAATGLQPEQVVVTFSHTHAAGLLDTSRRDLPGGELIEPYLQQLAADVGQLIQSACARMAPVTITYGAGRCALAAHRDAWDEVARVWVCGFHPEGPVDDTVLVARVTGADDRVVATIVNYGCHPTTLAWGNTQISPDYPGALRETVERATGAPCVFLLGACGDVGPREGYVGETAVADRNGRQLGYAALAACEALPPPQRDFVYDGPVISGATLGAWSYHSAEPSRAAGWERFARRLLEVPLAYRSDRPTLDQLQAERAQHLELERAAQARGDAAAARDEHALVERLSRALTRWSACPPGDALPYQVALLRLGDAVWVLVESEPYQQLQTELRRRFPQTPLVVVVLANGWRCSYLPPADRYGLGLYQETVAMLAPGCLETLIDAIDAALRGPDFAAT